VVGGSPKTAPTTTVSVDRSGGPSPKSSRTSIAPLTTEENCEEQGVSSQTDFGRQVTNVHAREKPEEIVGGGISTSISHMLNDFSLDLIGIQETMKHDHDIIFYRKLDDANKCFWKWVPSIGKSCGTNNQT
jgi:hypothetical protein